ncbi:MAG: hypothetical protein ABW217_17075 [Polyangiaceae bacterium]
MVVVVVVAVVAAAVVPALGAVQEPRAARARARRRLAHRARLARPMGPW